MAFEGYQIQRASDGKTLYNRFKNLSGIGLLPLNPADNNNWANVTNSTMAKFFVINTDYTRNFKKEYAQIGSIIDQLPANGEIYRLNPVFVNVD